MFLSKEQRFHSNACTDGNEGSFPWNYLLAPITNTSVLVEATTRTVKRLTNVAERVLQACFDCTDWSVFEAAAANKLYFQKLKKEFPAKEPASVWKGLRNIKYKTLPPHSVQNQQLADDLNVLLLI